MRVTTAETTDAPATKTEIEWRFSTVLPDGTPYKSAPLKSRIWAENDLTKLGLTGEISYRRRTESTGWSTDGNGTDWGTRDTLGNVAGHPSRTAAEDWAARPGGRVVVSRTVVHSPWWPVPAGGEAQPMAGPLLYRQPATRPGTGARRVEVASGMLLLLRCIREAVFVAVWVAGFLALLPAASHAIQR